MPAIQIDHTALECVERGVGEPLLFVHGSASDLRTWQVQQEAFAPDYRAIAYSRRYHWPNVPIEAGAPYSMLQHVADLAALIDKLDIAPVHLIGHSYGGFVSLLLALEQSHLLRSLTLIEPPAITLFVSDPPQPTQLAGLLARRPRTALALIGFALRGLQPARAAAGRGDMTTALERFGRTVLGDGYFERLTPARRDQLHANGIREEFSAALPPLRVRDVVEMAVPTLLVNGRDSPALFLRIIERLDELLPQSQRVQIERASHSVHEDQPAAFAAAVRCFLAERA
jgi:pimeloyl-ACP methyl ester carboxylesterase